MAALLTGFLAEFMVNQDCQVGLICRDCAANDTRRTRSRMRRQQLFINRKCPMILTS